MFLLPKCEFGKLGIDNDKKFKTNVTNCKLEYAEVDELGRVTHARGARGRPSQQAYLGGAAPARVTGAATRAEGYQADWRQWAWADWRGWRGWGDAWGGEGGDAWEEGDPWEKREDGFGLNRYFVNI